MGDDGRGSGTWQLLGLTLSAIIVGAAHALEAAAEEREVFVTLQRLGGMTMGLPAIAVGVKGEQMTGWNSWLAVAFMSLVGTVYLVQAGLARETVIVGAGLIVVAWVWWRRRPWRPTGDGRQE